MHAHLVSREGWHGCDVLVDVVRGKTASVIVRAVAAFARAPLLIALPALVAVVAFFLAVQAAPQDAVVGRDVIWLWFCVWDVAGVALPDRGHTRLALRLVAFVHIFRTRIV